MAIQKKSLIGKRQSVKKALVAKRVSSDVSKAAQVKAPSLAAPKHAQPYVAAPRHAQPYVAAPKAKFTLKSF